MNKRQFNLTSALLRGQWAIDPMYAMQHLPLIERMLGGEHVSFYGDDEQEAPEPVASLYVLDAGSWRRASDQDPASMTGVQFLSIEGPMMKHGTCGDAGTTDYVDALQAAYKDKRVNATVIGWDTPGGQIDGTPTLHDAVRNPAKPTVSLITDGMMCSAGYWGAAPSDAILASQPTDIVGSIGVYTTLRDVREYYAKAGIKITDVYSSISSLKNVEYRKALEGDLAPLIARLDKSANAFIKTVMAARGAKLTSKDWQKGGTYSADDALKEGLIDGISSKENALDMAADMAKTRTKKSFNFSNNTKSKTEMSGLVARVMAAINGQASEENNDATPHDVAIEALGNVAEQRQTRIVALEGQVATLTTERDAARTIATTAQTRVAELEGQVAALTTERDTFRATAETYGAQPGAAPTPKASDLKAEGTGGTPSPRDLTANNSMNKTAAAYGL
jgi:protease IV